MPLERRFAELIDVTKPYLVFVTPEDDSNGLYVSRRSPKGFVVRENRRGTSSIAFEYRIVASPADTPSRRLPAPAAVPAGAGSIRHVTTPTFDVPSLPAKPQ